MSTIPDAASRTSIQSYQPSAQSVPTIIAKLLPIIVRIWCSIPSPERFVNPPANLICLVWISCPVVDESVWGRATMGICQPRWNQMRVEGFHSEVWMIGEYESQ